MIDLYYAVTGNSLRAVVALEECALPYRRHRIDLTKGEHKTPEFLKMNPLGAVPVMVDHDGPGGEPLTLAQSGAITLYAAEKAGRFIPADLRRRQVAMQWFMAAVTDAAPGSAILFYMSNFAPDRTAANEAYLQGRLLGVLAGFEGQLQGREFIAGEISVADLALFPVVNSRRATLQQTGTFSNLLRWADAMAARPGVARALTY